MSSRSTTSTAPTTLFPAAIGAKIRYSESRVAVGWGASVFEAAPEISASAVASGIFSAGRLSSDAVGVLQLPDADRQKIRARAADVGELPEIVAAQLFGAQRKLFGQFFGLQTGEDLLLVLNLRGDAGADDEKRNRQ